MRGRSPATIVPQPSDALIHRTNSGPRIRQTAPRVSDRSRYRRLAGRIIVVHDGRIHSRSPGHRDRSDTDQWHSGSKGPVATMGYFSEERRANMNEDILKGKWKEIKRNSWGFCSRSTDMPRTKLSRNTRISSSATRGSNVLPLTITWNQGG